MVKEATPSLYKESQAVEKAESKLISKENVSYAIFEMSNKKVVEDVTKNPQSLYLLYGLVGSGKTSVLNYLFNIAKNKRPECVFLDGNLVNIPRRFFASIGGKIESHEDWRVSGRRVLRKFENNGILFIDDFDKMLNELGDDFAAFLRASIQEFKIGVVATATSESKEFKKTIISYNAPFYRFFEPIKVEYDTKSVNFLASKVSKELKKEDAEKLLEAANGNIDTLELLIKNYDKNITRSIQKTIKEHPIVLENLSRDLTSQQITILKDMCKLIIVDGKKGVTIKGLSDYSLLGEASVRSQINRMVKVNVVKRVKEGRDGYYVPNILLLERERLELSEMLSRSGDFFSTVKEHKKAEEGYREAIRINPELADAPHNNLGLLLENLGRYDEAEKEYRKAIELDPKNEKAHYNLGILLVKLERYEEAEKEYRTATDITPEFADAHNNLGLLLHEKLERYEEAEEELREAIDIDSEHSYAHNNLGNLLSDLKRFKDAEKEYWEAIKINPEFADAHVNLGTLLYVLKKYEEAEKEYRKAIEINPLFAGAHGKLGLMLSSNLNRPDEAKKEIEIAINLHRQKGDKEVVELFENSLKHLNKN